MPIVETECPDFLIDRTDGSTLGIEVTGIHTTSEIGKDRKKAEVEVQTKQQIRDIVGEPIHLNIRWSAMDGFPPIRQLVEEITHIAKCSPDLPLFEEGETFRLKSSGYWKVRAQRYVENVKEHPASQSFPQWVYNAFEPVTEFGNYVAELELARKCSEGPTIRSSASFVRTIDSPEDVRRLFAVSDKEDNISRYNQNGQRCDECWLLLHSSYEIVKGTTATWAAAEKEALRDKTLETPFDGVWWVNGGFELIELSPA